MTTAIDVLTDHGLALPLDKVNAGIPALAERLVGPHREDRDAHMMAAQFGLDLQAAGAKPEAVEQGHDLMEAVLNGATLSKDECITLYALISLWVADHPPVEG